MKRPFPYPAASGIIIVLSGEVVDNGNETADSIGSQDGAVTETNVQRNRHMSTMGLEEPDFMAVNSR